MEIQTIEMPKWEAQDAFRQYRKAVKDRKLDDLDVRQRQMLAEDKELMKGYSWLATHDTPIIDIVSVLREGGVDDQNRPMLAVGRADWRRIKVSRTSNHTRKGEDLSQPVYVFHDAYDYNESAFYMKNIIIPRDTFGLATWEAMNGGNKPEAIVPLIPPRLRPKGKLSDYFILWEAQWEPEAPDDPFLLKRISERFFAVLAQWDLTPLERAVIESNRLTTA